MNVKKLFRVSWILSANISSRSSRNRIVPCGFRRFTDDSGSSSSSKDASTTPNKAGGALMMFSFAALFKPKEEDGETPEQQLINAIKRSILCIQQAEYDKAEQMLHIALRMAQDIQSKDGITYVYDLMANLALDREQFVKAEKLFVDVMRRMFSDGYKEDDIQVLHVSSKIAHISHLTGEIEKALQGFSWTLEKIEEKIKQLPNDQELRELWGLTKNWYGQTLMENKNFLEAKKHLEEAFKVFVEINGRINAEALTMLNNLCVACTNLEDLTSARRFLDEALDIAKELPDTVEMGMLKANLGMLYLKQGLLQQAKDACTFAWRFGKRKNDKDITEHADYCLKLINDFNK